MSNIASDIGAKERQTHFSLWDGLSLIFSQMSPARRRQFVAVMVLMLAGAVAELASIGAVIPFITLLAEPSQTHHRWLSLVPGAHSGSSPLLIVGAAFIVFAIVAGLVRLQLGLSSRKFIFQLGHEITVEIQRRVLLQPYSFHVHRNTSTLLTALHKTDILVHGMLLPLMQALTGAVIAIVVIALLLAVAPVVTFGIAVTLLVAYAVFSAVFRERFSANSAIQKTSYDERTQVVQESLGGIREVIIDGSQSMYLNEFREIDLRLAKARATTQLMFLAPHYLIEMAGMVLIAAVALLITARGTGIAASLPVLGTLALAAQRLLPLVQDVYRGWSGTESHRSVFEQVVELLALRVPESAPKSQKPLQLSQSISLDDVSFTYPSRSSAALEKVNFKIPRGTMVAIVGATGSGKSTLVDLIMGLLSPTSGRVLVDDVPLTVKNIDRWHRSVAHVPQSIFLADTTIARNIAMSLPDQPPNMDRIVSAAEKAQLHDFVGSLPAGYETTVGERGVRLSGGQRQRLGIARAIYKEAPVFVLDEATSALDDDTEAAVIAALHQLRCEGRTILIVAHRLSTIRHCDIVARLDDGRIVEVSSSDELSEVTKAR